MAGQTPTPLSLIYQTPTPLSLITFKMQYKSHAERSTYAGSVNPDSERVVSAARVIVPFIKSDESSEYSARLSAPKHIETHTCAVHIGETDQYDLDQTAAVVSQTSV